VHGSGVLDYVTCWYLKAAQYIQSTNIEVGFVSTNSITQGEQVGILWNELLNKYGVKINFAYQTFKWTNQARGKAQVFVVIIGFGLNDRKEKWLYEYDDVRGEAHQKKVKNLNPYLVEANSIFISKRRKPIQPKSPEMCFGSMPNDGGAFILYEGQKAEVLKAEPELSKYIKPFLGSHEFINSEARYCFWLKGVEPQALRKSEILKTIIEKVRLSRLSSPRSTTKKLADTPFLFGEDRQPEQNYLALPEVSSERRKYIPIGFLSKDVIASNKLYTINKADKYTFGVLSSQMHMGWMRYVTGRLKGDYQYSAGVVYNNFPWPQSPSAEKIKKVEAAAQKVLDVRAKYPSSSLADLYDPLTMPPDLVKAHTELDKAVDLCYRAQAFTKEADRVAFLFERYEELVNPLLKSLGKKKK
jgi:hypothetical protein